MPRRDHNDTPGQAGFPDWDWRLPVPPTKVWVRPDWRPLWAGLWETLVRNLSRFQEIPVLMYHQVVARPPASSRLKLYVTAELLEKQLRFLKARGFEAVTFTDLVTRELPAKPVFLTFDDGYENHYDLLFPLLKKYRMRAVLYILGDRHLDYNYWDAAKGEPKARLLSAEQIREMSESGWVEFGGHSMRHTDLTQLTAADMVKDLVECKAAVEEVTGRPALSLAYPYGGFNESVKAATAKAGFVFGLAVNGGPIRFGEDLFAIHRINIAPWTGLFQYSVKTSGYYFHLCRWLHRRY